MQLGLVVGTAMGTLKHISLRGQKLLVVQPLLADRQAADGQPVLAVDGVGAGRGENVMITSDGRAAREMLQSDTTPVRWTIIGIVD